MNYLFREVCVSLSIFFCIKNQWDGKAPKKAEFFFGAENLPGVF